MRIRSEPKSWIKIRNKQTRIHKTDKQELSNDKKILPGVGVWGLLVME